MKNQFLTPLFEMRLSVNADCKLIFHEIQVLILSLHMWKKRIPNATERKAGYMVKVGCTMHDDGIWAAPAPPEHNPSNSELRFAVNQKRQADRQPASGQDNLPTHSFSTVISLVGLNLHGSSDSAAVDWAYSRYSYIPRKVKVVGTMEEQVHL